MPSFQVFFRDSGAGLRSQRRGTNRKLTDFTHTPRLRDNGENKVARGYQALSGLLSRKSYVYSSFLFVYMRYLPVTSVFIGIGGRGASP